MAFPIKPTVPIPTWATAPESGGIIDPGSAKRALGWQAAGAGLAYGEQPPYQWFNYMMNSYGQWLGYFNQYVDEVKTLSLSTLNTTILTNLKPTTIPTINGITINKQNYITTSSSIISGGTDITNSSFSYDSTTGKISILKTGTLTISVKLPQNSNNIAVQYTDTLQNVSASGTFPTDRAIVTYSYGIILEKAGIFYAVQMLTNYTFFAQYLFNLANQSRTYTNTNYFYNNDYTFYINAKLNDEFTLRAAISTKFDSLTGQGVTPGAVKVTLTPTETRNLDGISIHLAFNS
jgi:hypothetical protein